MYKRIKEWTFLTIRSVKMDTTVYVLNSNKYIVLKMWVVDQMVL